MLSTGDSAIMTAPKNTAQSTLKRRAESLDSSEIPVTKKTHLDNSSTDIPTFSRKRKQEDEDETEQVSSKKSHFKPQEYQEELLIAFSDDTETTEDTDSDATNPIDDFIEPLLDPKNAREQVYPILHPDIWDYYLKHQALFWTAAEVDLTKDLRDWRSKLTDDERHYLKFILAFFAGSDFIVIEKEAESQKEVTVLEYLFMLRDKMAREDVHSISYANMIEAYVTDPEEKERLKNAIKNIPSIKRKAEWFRKYITQGSFVEREVAGAISEGIFFSGSFCGIFWMKKRGLMPGLCDYNELISRDEGIHRDFAAMIYRNHVVRKLPEHQLIKMLTEAVDIEIEFCTESLPVKLIGMDHVAMIQYIKFVADKLLLILIGKKYYKVTNPFSWMVYISLSTVTDFFSHRPTQYSRQKNLTKKEENVIKFDEDY